MVTSFAIFLIILSSFSKSLSPEPPIDSTIILLYWSEKFEAALMQSGCSFLNSGNNLTFLLAIFFITFLILLFDSLFFSHLSSSLIY